MDQYFIKKKLEAKIVQIFFLYKNNNTIVSSKMFYNSLDKLAIKDIYAST
jgi:hypothetical protein